MYLLMNTLVCYYCMIGMLHECVCIMNIHAVTYHVFLCLSGCNLKWFLNSVTWHFKTIFLSLAYVTLTKLFCCQKGIQTVKMSTSYSLWETCIIMVNHGKWLCAGVLSVTMMTITRLMVIIIVIVQFIISDFFLLK